jgi:hypothetical protein
VFFALLDYFWGTVFHFAVLYGVALVPRALGKRPCFPIAHLVADCGASGTKPPTFRHRIVACNLKSDITAGEHSSPYGLPIAHLQGRASATRGIQSAWVRPRTRNARPCIFNVDLVAGHGASRRCLYIPTQGGEYKGVSVRGASPRTVFPLPHELPSDSLNAPLREGVGGGLPQGHGIFIAFGRAADAQCAPLHSQRGFGCRPQVSHTTKSVSARIDRDVGDADNCILI